jgi:Zn-dependent membrane protease YugP
VTLPVEWDASFRRALPLLEAGGYLSREDQRKARQILTAAALTYVAGSLASLLNLWRWLRLLKR